MHDTSLILHSTACLLVPLLLAALGELIAERSGAINISVEGMLLGSVFGAGAASDVTGSPARGAARRRCGRRFDRERTSSLVAPAYGESVRYRYRAQHPRTWVLLATCWITTRSIRPQ